VLLGCDTTRKDERDSQTGGSMHARWGAQRAPSASEWVEARDGRLADPAAAVTQVRKASALPVRYVLNSHHHADRRSAAAAPWNS
jgi:hypothetical protein